MISFPNAKINLGLRIISERDDGYHNIESVFYPINIFDILEVIKSDNQNKKITINYSNNFQIIKNDLCEKAYNLLDADFNLPPVNVFLHKNIPIGAGLGGGSSNAVSMLKILNSLFKLNLNHEQLLFYCKKIGSDCPFFLKNKPAFVSGQGDKINSNISISLSEYKLVLISPSKFISTKKVFTSIKNKKTLINNQIKFEYFIRLFNKKFINSWKENLKNDLELTTFSFIPELKKIKEKLYKMGAVYASMTGSGSSVYGLFLKHVDIDHDWRKDYNCFSFPLC